MRRILFGLKLFAFGILCVACTQSGKNVMNFTYDDGQVTCLPPNATKQVECYAGIAQAQVSAGIAQAQLQSSEVPALPTSGDPVKAQGFDNKISRRNWQALSIIQPDSTVITVANPQVSSDGITALYQLPAGVPAHSIVHGVLSLTVTDVKGQTEQKDDRIDFPLDSGT